MPADSKVLPVRLFPTQSSVMALELVDGIAVLMLLEMAATAKSARDL